MSYFVELTDKDNDLNILVDLHKVTLITYLEDGTTKLETDVLEIEVHEGYKTIKDLMSENGLLHMEI